MKKIKKIIPQRSYSGEVWKTNISNKKRLIKDFHNSCAYCDDLDIYSGGPNNYHVEHFAPKNKFPHLKYTYDNLLCACPYCNISKSNKWPSESSYINVVGNIGFIDPCCSDYYKHLARNENGSILYLTELGKYMYFEMKLYLKRHEIIYNLEQINERRILLKKKISEREKEGRNTDKLVEAYKNICVLFCQYFDLFTNEIHDDNENKVAI